LQQRGASGIEVSILVICEALPMVVLGKLIGKLIDRFDSRLVLVVSGTGQVLACLALAQAQGFAALIAGAIALSVVSGVAVPARQALLPAMVVRDDLPKASAIGQTAGSAGMMLGPALAGFLVGGIGPKQTLQWAAIGFLATILAGLLIRTRRGGAPATQAEAERVNGWKLNSDRLLWSTAWGMTAVMAALSAVNVVLVFFIMRTLGSTEEVYGVVDSMWTIGMLAGAWVFARLIKPSTSDTKLAYLLFSALGIISLSMVAVGSVRDALWIIPFYLIGGAHNGGLNVLGGTLNGRRVPAHARGRASTAIGMRVQAGALVGYVSSGLLLELFPPRGVLLGAGIAGVLTVLVVMPLVLRAYRATVPVPRLAEVG
jgi:MFS family permease